MGQKNKHTLTVILLVMLAPFVMWLVWKRGVGAIGLTPILEPVFNFLDMNG
jgi:hypothetical protein